MGITDLDPIPHGLIFERFLNPERVSMPDVDIDFETEDGVPVGIEDITPNVRVGRGHRVQQPGRDPQFAGQRGESGNLRPHEAPSVEPPGTSLASTWRGPSR
jgi:hypothetical protein